MNNIIIAGCGALGSQIAWQIASDGDVFTLYDDDRVEDSNVFNGTSIYSRQHIGQLKVNALASLLAYKYNVISSTISRTVKRQIGKGTISSDILVDCFDNAEARSFAMNPLVPTVHIAIGEHGQGLVQWDSIYQLPMPKNWVPRGENPVCTNELGRNLILFTATVASVIINNFLSGKGKENVIVSENLEIMK